MKVWHWGLGSADCHTTYIPAHKECMLGLWWFQSANREIQYLFVSLWQVALACNIKIEIKFLIKRKTQQPVFLITYRWFFNYIVWMEGILNEIEGLRILVWLAFVNIVTDNFGLMWCGVRVCWLCFVRRERGRWGVCADQDQVIQQRILFKLKGLLSFYYIFPNLK